MSSSECVSLRRQLSNDIVREIIDRLPAKDLVRTRVLDRSIKHYIDKAASIQLCILRDRLGIAGVDDATDDGETKRLRALQRTEDAQATLAYGLSPSKRVRWKVTDWPTFVPGLLATAGKYCYSSDWDVTALRATQIKRFSMDKASDSNKAEVHKMDQPFSSWAVDVAEGILVVFWTASQSPWESPMTISQISILDLWTLKPLSPKHKGIVLATTPGAQYHHRLSIRGNLIAIAYLKGTHPERSDTGEVLVYDWRTGVKDTINLPSGSQVKSAEIVSTCAILVGVSTELSKYMQLRLYAIHSDLHEGGLEHVATYYMPRLHQYLWVSDIILRSSPVSMSCAVTGATSGKGERQEMDEGVVRMEVDGEEVKLDGEATSLQTKTSTKTATQQTRMRDGHGIVHVTMKLAGFLMWEDGTIGREWMGTLTGCMLISALHEEAGARVRARSAGVPSPEGPTTRSWETWAADNFHWMPSHYRPTQQSLCGYRILVPLPQKQQDHRPGRSRMVNLVMYDFNPKTVKKYLGERAKEIDVEIPLSKTNDTRVKESISPIENDDVIFAHGQDTNGGLQCLTVKQLRSSAVDACAAFFDHDKIVLQSIVDDGTEAEHRYLDVQVLLMEDTEGSCDVMPTGSLT